MSVSSKIQNVIDWLSSVPIAENEEKNEEKNGLVSSVQVLGMGNPLLDISCPVDESYLQKYDLRAGNAILAESKHIPMYEELSNMPNVEFIGGGSTLNSIRVCQWMLQQKGATGYFGCIGNDKFGSKLKQCATDDNVACHFMIHDTIPTGTCAVCITQKERSLVANLSAANEFKKEHLDNVVSKKMIESAKIIYSAGFFITVSLESMLIAAKHCMEHNKPYCFNFSAEFIVSVFKDRVSEILPYCTHVFSNESESLAWAKANDVEFENMQELALKISKFKCVRKEGRKVIITQGKKPVVVGHNGETREYPVKLLPPEKIVDFNGAGDAFVGGFLSQLLTNQEEKICVAAATYCAQYIIQTSGTKLVGKPNFKIEDTDSTQN